MITKLSVNLNAVAMLRNRRDLPWPSVTGIGRMALQAGAYGLTVHPRPDERHIRFSDLPELRALIDEEFPEAEFNMEGYPTDAFLALVLENRPDQVTLVPDDPAQATSDHGWDFRANHNLLREVCQKLKGEGFRISLFADGDGDRAALEMAKDAGADRIELYTGPYGGCYDNPKEAAGILEGLAETAKIAGELGLDVNAGHDLTVANLPPLVKALPNLAEVSIGHGLMADALIYGIGETVRRFRAACGEAV